MVLAAISPALCILDPGLRVSHTEGQDSDTIVQDGTGSGADPARRDSMARFDAACISHRLPRANERRSELGELSSVAV